MSATYDFRGRVALVTGAGSGMGMTTARAFAAANAAAAMQAILRDQPLGRIGRADEVAAAVLRLCSPGASFALGLALPVSFALRVALPVDGGFVAR